MSRYLHDKHGAKAVFWMPLPPLRDLYGQDWGGGGKSTNTFYFINFIVLFDEGKLREHESSDSGAESYESSDSMLQSWNSQSSLVDLQRVPSYESFEDDCSQSLCLNKPTMSFKDYIQERSDPVEQGKPVIPAAILAGFTGE